MKNSRLQTHLPLKNNRKNSVCTMYIMIIIIVEKQPFQAANCCRNSRLVVDEDDLMRFKN